MEQGNYTHVIFKKEGSDTDFMSSVFLFKADQLFCNLCVAAIKFTGHQFLGI